VGTTPFGSTYPFTYAYPGATDFFQVFPLSFESPLARVSLRINEKLRFNAGYQYYGYNEDFSSFQNYRAHTGYTSVTWSF
jgi:hypothetical protein